MVLTNLFAGSGEDADIKNRFCTQQWKERVGQIERLALKHIILKVCC